jgi:hypothetical protein
MKRSLYILTVSFTLLVATLATARPASATLGESAASVTTDRKALSTAQGAKAISAGYTVQEIVSDATTIREYISPAGIVFAVAWNGLTNPDLTQLLGSYAGEYHQALKTTPRLHGRRFSRVKTNRLVVEKWGHMRNLRGRAYVPDLIPPRVNVDDIK